MRKVYCDICGKEIVDYNPVDFGSSDLFYDINGRPIVDVCRQCFSTLYCCINMMKETGWRPYFVDAVVNRDPEKHKKALNTLHELEDRTGLKLIGGEQIDLY